MSSAAIGPVVTDRGDQTGQSVAAQLEPGLEAGLRYVRGFRAATNGDANGMTEVGRAFADAEAQNTEVSDFVNVKGNTTGNTHV